MQATTRQMIETVLTGDNTTSATERKAILAVADGLEPIIKPKLINRRQAAEILNCSPKTFIRYVKKGLIREIRFTSHRVRYEEAEVIRFARKGVVDEA